MSVEIPKVAVAFGSVTPPQGDILDLSVHLGCTKEVSSFSCLLQNFDKKYSPRDPTLSKSTPSTTTSIHSVEFSNQRQCFYANGRFWLFYSDGTNLVYRTSLNGSSWSAPTTIRACDDGTKFSIHFDGTYFHYAYATSVNDDPVYYRRGHPNSDGSITWSAAEQEAFAPIENPGGPRFYRWPSITVDSEGCPWIAIQHCTELDYPYISKSSTNDGTWVTQSGFPYQLSTTSGLWYTTLVALTQGKIYVIWTRDGFAGYGRLWNGSSWEAQETPVIDIEEGHAVSMVAIGDTVYVAYNKDGTAGHLYSRTRTSGEGWGSEISIAGTSEETAVPVLSFYEGTNTVYCFFVYRGLNPTDIILKRAYFDGAAWHVTTIDQENTMTERGLLSCYEKSGDDKIVFIYLKNAASPYDIVHNIFTPAHPINVGDSCHFDIGRGTYVPLILTGRVEEIEPESTPHENYIRVRGRCWGEKIFRRVVTKTYENWKGESIVIDLMDSYAGLSHVRTNSLLTSDAAAGQKDVVVADGSIFTAGMLVSINDDNAQEYNEVASVVGNTVTMVNNLAHTYTVAANGKVWIDLIEKTDTTYTLLEYENTPVFDILKYIAESADKSGVIGFDFRVEYDGKFAFFPKTSKTSPISLSERIEHSRYSKDIHRVRNKIKVYGAAEKPYPLDTDGQPWSDSLTEDLTKPDNYLLHADGRWDPLAPTHETLDIETTIVHTGSRSVKISSISYDYYMGLLFTFNSDKYVNGNKYPRLCFTLREDQNHNKKITVGLRDKDGNDCWQGVSVEAYNQYQSYVLGVGKQNQESWTLGNSVFDWENIKEVLFDFHQNTSAHGAAYVDRMHFSGCRWSATEEDASSQSSYGLRELCETDEELHSDHECSLRGKALLNHLSQPAQFLTLRTTCLDYGNDRLLPGDKISVYLPNENINSDFRIISVEYRVSARDQTLEITLELGKEKPLLADYLYGLRSTTVTVEKLMRTKAGLVGGGFVGGGGGGGGGGMVQHGNEWHEPDFFHDGMDLIPDADNSRLLGTSDRRWREIHAVELAISRIASPLIPNADGTYDLGDGTTPLRWRHAYLSGSLYVVGRGYVGWLEIAGVTVIDSARVLHALTGVGVSLIPTVNATYDLGSSTNKWNNVYCVTLHQGDSVFMEKTCPICGGPFKKGEALINYVKSVDEEGTRTVPAHLKCCLETDQND